MGPTVPSGMYLHVGRTFGRAGSQSITRDRDELERRQVPLYH